MNKTESLPVNKKKENRNSRKWLSNCLRQTLSNHVNKKLTEREVCGLQNMGHFDKKWTEANVRASGDNTDPLNQRQRLMCLTWAEGKDLTAALWLKVLFLGESTFYLEMKVSESGGRVEKYKIWGVWSPVQSSCSLWGFRVMNCIFKWMPYAFTYREAKKDLELPGCCVGHKPHLWYYTTVLF